MLLIVYKVENQYRIWQMRALWSGCQDSVVFSITQLYVIRGICLLEGEGGPNPLPDIQLIFKQAPPSSPHPFHPPWICFFSLSLFLSLPSPRCTSAPTASSPTQTWIVSECTWWRSTLSSPCYDAHYAKTCSTTRSTCSSTSHTSTVWLLTVLTSLLPQ